MYYVYILYSKRLKKFYTGFTKNLEQRILEHNSNKVPFTSKGTPWQTVYFEVFFNEKDARDEEKFLKTGKGRERRKYLLKNAIGDLN